MNRSKAKQTARQRHGWDDLRVTAWSGSEGSADTAHARTQQKTGAKHTADASSAPG
jgi:hypothetical protein